MSAPFAGCLAVDPYYLSLISVLVLPGHFAHGLPPDLQTRYREAVERIGAGDHEAASARLEALAGDALGRDRGLCRATEAVARCAAGDESGAAAALDRALSVAPDCAAYHHMAGALAIRRRAPAEAAAWFHAATRLAPDFGLAWAARALLAGLGGHWSEAEAPARRALACGNELGPGLVALCLMFATLFQDKPVPGPFLMPPPPDAATAARVLSRLPGLEANSWMPPPGEDPVILVVCDTVYLTEHALPLVWSLEEVGAASGVAVHLHIINPLPADRERLAALALSLQTVRLGHSFETVDLERYGSAAVYFSCIRFCRLDQYVRTTGRPTLMVDADTLFRQPPDHIPGWDEAGVDIGLVASPDAPPWESFLAGAVYVAPTPAARDFLSTATVFVGQNLIARKGRWFLDQIALTLAHRRRSAMVHLRTWSPAQMFDLHHHDDAIIWTVTLRKNADSRYQDYKQSLNQRYGARYLGS